ncbi:MAG TPA: rhomboid family intramembrane serine protease [Chthoniobacterales bacterium]
MIDLNHILLFIAVASAVILLARLVRLGSARPPGWMAASIIVLLVSGGGYFFWPAGAGYLGGIFWALLLLAPSLAERRIESLLLEKRYRSARHLAIVRRILHPWGNPPQLSALLRCLELARDGHLSLALDGLARLRSKGTRTGESATAYTYALTENWSGLAQWCRGNLKVTSDPAVRALYLRSLGETGALDDLAWTFAARSQRLAPRETISPEFAQDFAYLLAFSGRSAALVRLFQGALAGLARDHQEFWLATAELAEGKTAAALVRLRQLQTSSRDAILLRAVERRLATMAEFPAPRLSPASEKLLTRLLAETPLTSSLPGQKVGGGTPAVWAFIILNIAMFLVEILAGGATNDRTLALLGALRPVDVIVGHEYWRLLTALFLHYGLLHISINLYALYLLGPELERMIGSLKFAFGYLISGLGSSAGVVLLYLLGLTKADELVGASGCVMGIIGISAGLLLRHRQSPLVGRRLREILVIVVFQTLFDLWTPQVSMGAHLCGFGSGLLVGIVFAARR